MARLLGLVIFLVMVAPASAAEHGAGARFTFTPAENGVFRLDAETGIVTLCVERNAALICMRAPPPSPPEVRAEVPPDDRIAALEARMAALEAHAGSEGASGRGAAMDRVKRLADRMMRQVFALVREMKGEPKRDDL